MEDAKAAFEIEDQFDVALASKMLPKGTILFGKKPPAGKMLQMETIFKQGTAVIGKGLVLLLISTGVSRVVPAQENSSSTDQVRAEPNQPKRALPDSPKPRQTQNSFNSKEPIPPRRLSLGERFNIYRHSITNVTSVTSPAFGALINQANDDPPQWGQGAAGYARRFGSGYGRVLITRTLRFGIAAADHEDPFFHPSNESGIWRRASYATVHYFWVQSDEGTPMPALSRFGSVYGAAFISNAWYPASHATPRHAFLRGTTALGAGVGWNVFREFWPDIRDALRRHK